MLTSKRKLLIAAFALAGAMSVGAVAAAQAQGGSFGSTDDSTPGITVLPSPSSDDDGLRGDGTVDDNSVDDDSTVDPTPDAPNGLPTDADHPEGDDSIGRVDGGHGDDDSVGDDDGEDVGDDDGDDVADDDAADDDAADDDTDNSGPSENSGPSDNSGSDDDSDDDSDNSGSDNSGSDDSGSDDD